MEIKSEMDSPIDIVNEAIKNGTWTEYSGNCETHGESTLQIPTRVKGKWVCRECCNIKHAQEESERWRTERNETLHRIAEVPRKYRGQKFAAVTDEQRAARATVKAFRDFYFQSQQWAVLVMMGGVGTGKTLMASEFAESMINNHSISVRYCTAKQMISEIQASYGEPGKTEEGEILRFVQYGVLIIDEIDAKPDRENANILLTEIINRRYNAEMPVVVITNQPFDNLDKFVGSRVDDRLHENAFVCNFDWPSFRRAGYEPPKVQRKGFQ